MRNELSGWEDIKWERCSEVFCAVIHFKMPRREATPCNKALMWVGGLLGEEKEDGGRDWSLGNKSGGREREAGVQRVKTLAVGKASLFTRECSECAQGCS